MASLHHGSLDQTSVHSSSADSSFDYPWSSEEDDCTDAQMAALQDEFADLEQLQFLSTEGIDKKGRRILRIVGKFFPAPIIDPARLRNYVIQKISREIADENYCIVYFHSRAIRAENCPGIFTLRGIYESLPQACRSRLEVVYFVHPGLLSRTVMGTIGRFLFSDGLYDKVNYISRLEFLWQYVRKGQLDVPDIVYEHDRMLEDRPLADYWVESDPWVSSAVTGAGCHHSVRWVP